MLNLAFLEKKPSKTPISMGLRGKITRKKTLTMGMGTIVRPIHEMGEKVHRNKILFMSL
jgi:hypothetical protein